MSGNDLQRAYNLHSFNNATCIVQFDGELSMEDVNELEELFALIVRTQRRRVELRTAPGDSARVGVQDVQAEEDAVRYTVDVQIHTCPFHAEFPGESYAGCTCSTMYTQRECTPEERADKRRRRLEAERTKRRARFFGI